jgi:glyoxylase-like metal-dependent hydrolase (beta-lactamase superfamily II)
LRTYALAGAPQLKTQAPGWYRMMLGDFEVTSLNDGTFPMDVAKLLTNITPKQLDEDLSRSFLTNPVEASVNGFLINTGTKLVLIDTGAGTFFGPTVGKLVANLEASGYRPEQVDEVYITHMHSDHIGGLIKDGKMALSERRRARLSAGGGLLVEQGQDGGGPRGREGRFRECAEGARALRRGGTVQAVPR